MNFKDVKKIVIPESAPQETEVVVANTSKAFSSSSTQSSFTYLNYYPTSGSNLGSNSKLRIKGTITSVSGTEYDEGGLYYRNSSGNLTSIGFSAGQTKSFDVVCYLTSEVSSTVWEVFKVEQYNAFATIGNQMRVQLNKTNSNNLDIYVYNTFAQALFTLTITEVSEYQTVENPVVKITDSNGNILWQKSLYELYEGYYLTSHSYSYNTNYIDLGIKWNNNWKLECKFYKPTTITQWGRLMGTGYDTSTEVYVNYNAQTNGSFVINYGNTYGSELSNVYQTNVEYNFAFGNRGTECRCYFLKPGGSWTSFGTAWTPSNRNSTHNFRLFSNEQSDRDGIYGIGKVQINGPTDLWSEEGALMLLVPARRKSDNKLGMYDKNNDVFYPVVTSGSGYFTITDVSGNIIYQ